MRGQTVITMPVKNINGQGKTEEGIWQEVEKYTIV